jgi:DNA-binding NarL/FixJ family response regulator
VRILLADDHPVLLEGIERILEDDGRFDVVATTGSGAAVLPLVGWHHPEVVLLDMRLPKLDGLGCLERISARYPIVKVIMLSMFAEPEQVQLAFARGACGHLEQSIPAADLPAAIRELTSGTARSVGHARRGASLLTNATGVTDRELATSKAAARGLCA